MTPAAAAAPNRAIVPRAASVNLIVVPVRLMIDVLNIRFDDLIAVPLLRPVCVCPVDAWCLLGARIDVGPGALPLKRRIRAIV